MKFFLWLMVLFIGPFVIIKVDEWRKKGIGEAWAWWEAERMPDELRTATLFLSEQEIETSHPLPMHGRVDQVYMTNRKVLIPLDTKSRSKAHVYESDIIQLSVYRLILLHQYNVAVANYGYIRTVTETTTGERVCYIKIKLLSERKVVKLWHRYQSISTGQVKPVCTCNGDFHKHIPRTCG